MTTFTQIKIRKNSEPWVRVGDAVHRLDNATGQNHGLFRCDHSYAICAVEEREAGEVVVLSPDPDPLRLAEQLEAYVKGLLKGQKLVAWLSVGDVAAQEGLHPETVRDEIKRGRLPAKFRPDRWCISPGDLPAWRIQRFLADGRRTPKSNKV